MTDKSNGYLIDCLKQARKIKVGYRKDAQRLRLYDAIMDAKEYGTPIDLAFVAGGDIKHLDGAVQTFWNAWGKYLDNMAKGVANALKGGASGTEKVGQGRADKSRNDHTTTTQSQHNNDTTFEEKAKEIKDLQEFTPLPQYTINKEIKEIKKKFSTLSSPQGQAIEQWAFSILNAGNGTQEEKESARYEHRVALLALLIHYQERDGQHLEDAQNKYGRLAGRLLACCGASMWAECATLALLHYGIMADYIERHEGGLKRWEGNKMEYIVNGINKQADGNN